MADEPITPATRTFHAGDVVLQCGITLPDARVVYDVHGRPNAAGDNVIVFPTRYGGTAADNRYLIGRGMALDPARWCIVVPNMLGNGVSSSPANTPRPLDGPRFPRTTIHDNVVVQGRLLAEELGVERVALVVGWSMGGQQAYEWASWFPERVPRAAVLCGAAKTTPHTHVFLEGVRAALTCDVAFAGGEYREPPLRGLRAMGRVWAGWALSQAFYREHMYRGMGYATLEDFLVRYWEGIYLPRDANNLVSMIRTWQHADIGANERYGGDFEAAMAAIEAQVLVMPGRTDLYFPPEDSEHEVSLLARGELRVIPSVWGHYAGGGRATEDVRFIDRALGELLARPVA
ncbi:MAG: homoserine O-acetyltransferase/O-succinyltransferase [Solirubrobacteraceae bacterium]|nr:homoserine O-acetyltransferase/O-succinyltransferase [Solirubrobacteraceae bacterium]